MPHEPAGAMAPGLAGSVAAADPPLRVLHFCNAEARGGAEEHMLTLLRGLDRRQVAPSLACPAPLLPHLPDLPRDVRVLPVAPVRAWRARDGWKLTRFLRRERVQLVHVHLSCATRAAAPWVRLAGAPVLIETTHVRENWRRGWKRAAWLDRLLDPWLDGYIAVSAANAEYLRLGRRLPPEKIHTIRNGIDLRRFRACPSAQQDPRPNLGIAPGGILLVCAARLEPQKGHAVLLRALAEIPDLPRPRIHLVCLGEGRLGAELRLLARQLGVESRVIFAGFSPDVPAWLAVADVFVLPSYYEGLPLSAIEAAAAGCPVIATAVDGTPEVVRHGETGLLVPPGDPHALALALRRLIADPVLRKAMGEAARAWALGRFDDREQVAATATLYHQLWRARARRQRRTPAPRRHSMPPQAVERHG
jgi:glycosyltransferase involved in cell wall biosynthesis